MLPWQRLKQAPQIAVIGDVILDEYLEGEVQRISPEAPVPIHLVTKTSHTGGGAANSARNIQRAGGQAFLFSVWGDDAAAMTLKGILVAEGINLDGVATLAERPTIKKTRISAGNQQMLRVDWEQAHPIPEAVQEALLAKLQAGRYDAILLSDYGKGALPAPFLQAIFAYAQANKIPTVVDPKGKDFNRYSGCRLITPNRKEACEALGLDPADAPENKLLGAALQARFQLQQVLVTLGKDGMIFSDTQPCAPIYKASKAREVFDVSGAGDTVAAMMSLCLAVPGCSMVEALDLATIAAGLVVEKWGTQPVNAQELLEAIESEALESKGQGARNSQSKVKALQTALTLIQQAKSQGKKIVFTNGCFDLLHAGHLSYLEEARSLGGFLMIGINSDASVARLKGPTRPIVPLEQRARLIAGLGCVDCVVAFEQDTPEALIRAVSPDVLVKGADYTEEQIAGAAFVRSQGGEVCRIALLDGLSSSALLRRLQEHLLER